MEVGEGKNRNGSSRRRRSSNEGGVGLAEFWDCLDNIQREELLTIQRQDVLDHVTCPSCRQLLGSAMEALEEESKGSLDPPGTVAPSRPKDKAGSLPDPSNRAPKFPAAKASGGPAPAPSAKAPSAKAPSAKAPATKAAVSKALARPIKPPPPAPVRQPLLRRLDDGAFVSLQSMKNADAEEGTEFVAYVGGHFELAQSRAQDASIRQHLMRPGSSAVPPPCYCEDKLNVRFVDMLTYPRPIRKFHLLLDRRMLLGELRELLATEVLIESMAMLVLLVRGKPLRPEDDALPLEQLGLKTGTLVVVSRVLGAPAEEGAGIDDKNKQFVGDLLFGNASGPGVTALGQGPVTSGNSSGGSSSGGGSGESAAAGVVGGASDDSVHSSGEEGNGAVGQSLPWGGGVVGSHSINHGCQILGRALDSIAKARVVGAWEAELLARQHEADLLAELEAEADNGADADDCENAKSRSRRKKEKEKKRREAQRVKEKKLEDERAAAREEKTRLEQERVERERRERLDAERRQQQKREEEWMAAQVERQRKELEALTQERAKQQQREAAEQRERGEEEDWVTAERKEQQQRHQQQKAPPSPARPPPQQSAASQAKQRQVPQPQPQQQAKGAGKKDKRKKGESTTPAPGIAQATGAQKAAAAKPVANGGTATKGRALPAPAAAAPSASALPSPGWQQQQPAPPGLTAHALPQTHAQPQQPAPQQEFVAVPLFCSSCGTRSSVAGARFCAFCGDSVAGAAAAPAVKKISRVGANPTQLDLCGGGSANGLPPALHGGFSLGVAAAPAAAATAPAAVPAWLGGGTHQLGSYTAYSGAPPPQTPPGAPARRVNGVEAPATAAVAVSPPPPSSGERMQKEFAAAPGKVSPRALPLFQRLRQGAEDGSGGGGGGSGRGGSSNHGSGHGMGQAALLSS